MFSNKAPLAAAGLGRQTWILTVGRPQTPAHSTPCRQGVACTRTPSRLVAALRELLSISIGRVELLMRRVNRLCGRQREVKAL
jgi:hypothetical protein